MIIRINFYLLEAAAKIAVYKRRSIISSLISLSLYTLNYFLILYYFALPVSIEKPKLFYSLHEIACYIGIFLFKNYFILIFPLF